MLINIHTPHLDFLLLSSTSNDILSFSLQILERFSVSQNTSVPPPKCPSLCRKKVLGEPQFC